MLKKKKVVFFLLYVSFTPYTEPFTLGVTRCVGSFLPPSNSSTPADVLDLTQFGDSLSADRVRSHRLRVQSHETTLTSDAHGS